MSDGQRVEHPNEAEQKWIAANLRVSRSFANAYAGHQVADGVPPVEILDRAWTAWLGQWDAQPEGSREDPNPIVNAVGIAFGQHLVNALGLEWAVVTDQYGTEMAVHGNPGNIVVFPANLVAKRFESRTTGFIVPLFLRMCADIQPLRGGPRA
jgi:hypothetical protein